MKGKEIESRQTKNPETSEKRTISLSPSTIETPEKRTFTLSPSTIDRIEGEELMNLSQHLAENSPTSLAAHCSSEASTSQSHKEKENTEFTRRNEEVNGGKAAKNSRENAKNIKNKGASPIDIDRQTKPKRMQKETKKENERSKSRPRDNQISGNWKKEQRYNSPRQKEGERGKSRRSEGRRNEQKHKRKPSRNITPGRPRSQSTNAHNKTNTEKRLSPPRDKGEMIFRYRSRTQKYNLKPKKVDKAKWRIKLTQVKENRDDIILNRNSVLTLFKYIRKLNQIKSEDLLVVEPSHVNAKAKTVLYVTSTTLKNLILDCSEELDEMGYEVKVQSTKSEEDNKREAENKRRITPSRKQVDRHPKSALGRTGRNKSPEKNKDRARAREVEEKLRENRQALKENKNYESFTKTKDTNKHNKAKAIPEITAKLSTEKFPQKRCEPTKGIWSWLPKILREKKQT
ncbi:uncharacterized protein [Ambystoma mexicanum]|uniref:uncharacterized protein n=1 Tax=Ambystoma mexicanum TaxID=8296 RepID=UPI0037E8561D